MKHYNSSLEIIEFLITKVVYMVSLIESIVVLQFSCLFMIPYWFVSLQKVLSILLVVLKQLSSRCSIIKNEKSK